MNPEYLGKVIDLLNKYNTGIEEDILPCAERIVDFFEDEIFQAICDARGD